MIGNTSSKQKGRDSVAIVISVGGSDISVMQVANTDTYHLSRYSSFSGNWQELCSNAAEDTTKNGLLNMLSGFNNYETEKYYVLLVGSCGLIYKTIEIPVSVMTNSNDLLNEENIDQLKAICMSNLPTGYYKAEYSVSIGSVVHSARDSIYYVSCAYVPKVLIEGIKNVLRESSLPLFDIQPLAFCIQQAIDISDPAVIDISSGYISATKDGGIIIAKFGSENMKAQLLDYIKQYTNSIFHTNYKFRKITGYELQRYLKKSLTTVISLSEEKVPLITGAIGIAYGDADDIRKGEKMSDYIEKIKLIFKR